MIAIRINEVAKRILGWFLHDEMESFKRLSFFCVYNNFLTVWLDKPVP